MFCDKTWEDISCTEPVDGSKFRLCAGCKGEPDSEFCLATRLRDRYPRNRASITGRGNDFVPTPKRPPDRHLKLTPFIIDGRSRVFFFSGKV
jgi:hypothetical protein